LFFLFLAKTLFL